MCLDRDGSENACREISVCTVEREGEAGVSTYSTYYGQTCNKVGHSLTSPSQNRYVRMYIRVYTIVATVTEGNCNRE